MTCSQRTRCRRRRTTGGALKIDTRNGLLATEMTPPQFIQERVFLVLPEGLTGFDQQQAEEWAKRWVSSLAPTEKSDPNNLPVLITSPGLGEQRQGCRHGDRTGDLRRVRVVPA